MIRAISAPMVHGIALLLALGACSLVEPVPRLANPDPARNPPSTAAAPELPPDGVISVRPGDTVYAIARRYGLSPRTVIETNRLAPPYLLQVGDRVVLPVARVHVVRSGETASIIAGRYGTSLGQLAALNSLKPPYIIRVGQRLSLPPASDGSGRGVIAARSPQSPPGQTAEAPAPRAPGQPWSSDGSLNFPVRGSAPVPGALPAPAARPPIGGSDEAPPATGGVVIAEAPPPPPPTAPASAPSPVSVDRGSEAAAQVAVLTPPPRGGGRFLWPIEGRVISGFGPREGGLHNDGINIAAAAGTRVRAAENGVVVYAGNELKGFGNLLLIKHADGWTTAYAHADTLLVQRGDRVTRGQAIATVGQTGNVDRPQLHFEIRKGPRPIDPRSELPAAQATSTDVRSKVPG